VNTTYSTIKTSEQSEVMKSGKAASGSAGMGKGGALPEVQPLQLPSGHQPQLRHRLQDGSISVRERLGDPSQRTPWAPNSCI
jgi:hypothetical protein